jgi:Zn-dependent peptidase ImmA (M78 family)
LYCPFLQRMTIFPSVRNHTAIPQHNLLQYSVEYVRCSPNERVAMPLTSAQRDDYEHRAEDLLQAAYGSTSTITIPVDANLIADSIGLGVFEGSFQDDNIEGILDRPAARIYIKADSVPPRKKFTTAHEIGHYMLHQDVNAEVFYRMDVLNPEVTDTDQEAAANCFASSLLMPRQRVEQYWYLYRDVSKMADKFQVSITAMRWRLKNLGLLR